MIPPTVAGKLPTHTRLWPTDCCFLPNVTFVLPTCRYSDDPYRWLVPPPMAIWHLTALLPLRAVIALLMIVFACCWPLFDCCDYVMPTQVIFLMMYLERYTDATRLMQTMTFCRASPSRTLAMPVTVARRYIRLRCNTIRTLYPFILQCRAWPPDLSRRYQLMTLLLQVTDDASTVYDFLITVYYASSIVLWRLTCSSDLYSFILITWPSACLTIYRDHYCVHYGIDTVCCCCCWCAFIRRLLTFSRVVVYRLIVTCRTVRVPLTVPVTPVDDQYSPVLRPFCIHMIRRWPAHLTAMLTAGRLLHDGVCCDFSLRCCAVNAAFILTRGSAFYHCRRLTGRHYGTVVTMWHH